MLSDCAVIISIALGSSLLGEGISWVLCYRTEDYKRLKRNIERTSAVLEKKRGEVVTVNRQKNHQKQVTKLEQDLQGFNRDMSFMRMKSTLALSVTMIALLGVMNNAYDGIVVAKLPFEPISFVRGISHRGLAGEDYTDCAGLFLYILTSMGIRTSLQKALGFEPPKAASGTSPFAPPTQ